MRMRRLATLGLTPDPGWKNPVPIRKAKSYPFPSTLKNKIIAGVIFSLCLLGASTVQAATITVNSFDAGWYARNIDFPVAFPGGHDPSNVNYAAGFSTTNNRIFRNFFVFDLSGVSVTITSAILRLHLISCCQGGGYQSGDSSETYNVYDVSTAISTLTAGGNGLGSVFDDLGSGTQYGSVVLNNSNEGLNIDIILNAAALSNLNAASGNFAIGGAVTTLSATSGADPDEFLWAFSNVSPITRQLVLNAVPLPGALLLFLSGFMAVGATARRWSRIK